ncbi:hypothetical protein D3C78_1055640 [compost metagenome]
MGFRIRTWLRSSGRGLAVSQLKNGCMNPGRARIELRIIHVSSAGLLQAKNFNVTSRYFE